MSIVYNFAPSPYSFCRLEGLTPLRLDPISRLARYFSAHRLSKSAELRIQDTPRTESVVLRHSLRVKSLEVWAHLVRWWKTHE